MRIALAFACAALCATALACGDSAREGSDPETSADDLTRSTGSIRIRIASGNLTSGDLQSYDPGHGARVFRALAPDVALIQELNVGDGSEKALRSFVDETFGPTFQVHRETGVSIPNGVVSRHPIRDRGTWIDPGSSGTRSFTWAQIDLPGSRDLWAVSVHLKASTDGEGTRTKQASALVEAIRKAVPKGSRLVIGGDLNTATAEEPCLAVLGEAVDVAPPFPADVAGNSNTNANRDKPYDWVLVDKSFRSEEVPLALGSAKFPHGIVFDTRTFDKLTSVPPALPDDSAAPNMQHMAVAKDFVLR